MYVSNNEAVIIRSHTDILKWCDEHQIILRDFNQPVIIPENVSIFMVVVNLYYSL